MRLIAARDALRGKLPRRLPSGRVRAAGDVSLPLDADRPRLEVNLRPRSADVPN
jgi:hypothetical protein